MINNKPMRRIGRLEQYFFLTFGVFIMAVAFYFFVIPSGIVTGGVTGIAMVFQRYFANVPISAFALIFSMVFLLLALLFLGKKGIFPEHLRLAPFSAVSRYL